MKCTRLRLIKAISISASIILTAYTPELTLATMGKIALWQKQKQFGITESREDAAKRLRARHGSNGRTFNVLGLTLPTNYPIGTWTNSFILGMIEGDGTNWPVHLTDNYGFFNDQSWWTNPKILIIGDSFVTCEHLQTNNITALVREFAPAVNIGVTGAGPLVELAALKAHWAKVSNSVELVVWCYYEGNDLQDASAEIREPLFASALRNDFSVTPDQSLLGLLPGSVDAKSHGFWWGVKTVATMQRTRLYMRYQRRDADGADIVARAVKEAVRFCGKPICLIRIRRGDTYVRELDWEWARIRTAAGAATTKSMDLKTEAYTPTRALAHYSHFGYDHLAEAIYIAYRLRNYGSLKGVAPRPLPLRRKAQPQPQ